MIYVLHCRSSLQYMGYKLDHWLMFYVSVSADLLYLLSPCYASWHIGKGQVSSTLLCCWLFFLLCPRCILSFISFSMVHLHVDFGLPLFLFPSVVHLRLPLLCPWCLWCYAGLLEILFGQNIFIIFLRLVLWKLESLLMSLSVILQHSEPYRSTDSTQLL